MEMLCPQCLTSMTAVDAQNVRCPACGMDYTVLFCRAAPETDAGWKPEPDVHEAIDLLPPGSFHVFCPSCSKKFRATDQMSGRKARCSCGEQFTIQRPDAFAAAVDVAAPDPFTALPAAEPPAGSAAMPQPFCSRHQTVPATRACHLCRMPICDTCAFTTPDGRSLCPDCAQRVQTRSPLGQYAGFPTGPIEVSPVSIGRKCQAHPTVDAVRLCRQCKAPICPTCDFSFPGGVHLCPTCATTTDRRLSPKRRRLVGWAFALAIWCTLGLAFLFIGAAADVEEEALGAVVGFLVFIPAIIGFALGLSSFDRRLGNPPVVWVAALWNVFIFAVMLLLVIVGNLM